MTLLPLSVAVAAVGDDADMVEVAGVVGKEKEEDKWLGTSDRLALAVVKLLRAPEECTSWVSKAPDCAGTGVSSGSGIGSDCGGGTGRRCGCRLRKSSSTAAIAVEE
jgi:hypothetical protein